MASLRLLREVSIPEGKRIGLMTHANTSENFKLAFRKFPTAPSLEMKDGRQCGPTIIKACDSGVFQKNGCIFDSYDTLYRQYEDLGVDYGVVIDFLKDKSRTLESAADALSAFKQKRRSFNLVGVAQGRSVDEYLDCYQELKTMGFSHIAVGGMLKRKERSARYVTVRDEALLRDVLAGIRGVDKTGWLFALGCYSPGRHAIFLENGVFGSDYKGWIFQYSGESPNRGDKRAQRSRFCQVRRFIESEVLARSQEWRSGSRLMVISCSKGKRLYSGRAQAINVYDGPIYRLLRKHLSDFSNENGLDILILSAKYGLIEPRQTIAAYNLAMTAELARSMKTEVATAISRTLSKKSYSSILVNMGQTYLDAFRPAIELCRANSNTTLLQGRIGERLKATKEWLLS